MDAGHYFTMGGIAVAALLLFYRKADSKQDKILNAPENHTFISNEPLIVGDRFRITDSETLIYELGLAPSIANIKSSLGLTNENWLKDGLPLIHSFISLVQRLPASESHHHAGDGGLVKHSLNVAALALLASNAKSWPPGAKTEDIARLGTVWRYGILTAALLHDIGKIITSFEIPLYKNLDDEEPVIWQPDTGTMVESGRNFYKVIFPDTKTDYSVHKTLGWTFYQSIVPTHARKWIDDSDPKLVNALRDYLTGNDEESSLSEIIRFADMESVRLDLKNGSRQRFASSKRKPLNEIVMDTLIEMLRDKGAYFSIATTAGGDLFYKNGIVYMMSKNVPDKVRDFLNANEPQLAKSFPSDNQPIFNTLFEYDLVEPNSFDPFRAVCNVSVTFSKTTGDLKTYPFTVLKFRPKTLFPDGILPAEFLGEIIEIETAKSAKSVKTHEVDSKINANLESTKDHGECNEIENLPSSIPTDYIVPEPPKKRIPEQSDNAITSEDAKSLGNIDDLILNHNLLSDPEEDVAEPAEPVITKPSDTDLPTLPAKETVKASAKEKNKLAPKFNVHAKQKTSSKDLQAILFSNAEQSDPQQKTEEPTQKKEDVALETAQTAISDESTDLNYEETAQAGLDEINTERATISYKSPRSVTVFQGDTQPVANETDQGADDKLLKHRSILKAEGNKFLNWLTEGLADGSISVNTNNAPIHFIEQGMLLVSPEIFKLYAHGFFNKNDPECPGLKAQTGFLSLGLNERTKKTGIFSAQIDGKHLFSCFLIPENRLHYLISSGSRPANNIDLKIVESNFGRSMKRKEST